MQGTQTARKTSFTGAETAKATADISKSNATKTCAPQKAHSVGTPKVISNPDTPKYGTTKPSSALKTKKSDI